MKANKELCSGIIKDKHIKVSFMGIFFKSVKTNMDLSNCVAGDEFMQKCMACSLVDMSKI